MVRKPHLAAVVPRVLRGCIVLLLGIQLGAAILVPDTVDSDGDVGWHTSLALDGGGYPRISCYDRCSADLKYARWDGSAWITETVDGGGWVGEDTSLALDGSGNPHTGYHDADRGALKYVHWTESDWETDMVDNEGAESQQAGSWTSLALEAGAGRTSI